MKFITIPYDKIIIELSIKELKSLTKWFSKIGVMLPYSTADSFRNRLYMAMTEVFDYENKNPVNRK